MDYTLRYKRGVGAEEQNVKNPSPEIIELVINELLPAIDYYIVFISDQRINGYDCIQTVIIDDDKPVIEFMVEVHYKTDTDFIYYRKFFTDKYEVMKMFRMFAFGIIPDISDWEDVTEKVTRSIEESI